MLLALIACEPAPAPPGAMVHVDGGVVRLGTRATPPVPGFVPPPPGEDPGLPDLGQAGHPRGNNPATPGLPPPIGGLPGPPHDVRVEPFSIDVTEVTRAQYAKFLVETGYRIPYVDEPWAEADYNWSGPTGWPRGTADHPVVLVNWYDAREYCAWAGKRLPTEAEWQLAMLGPASDERLFPWGDTYDGAKLNHGQMAVPNYDDSDGYLETSPVGAFPAGDSRWGLKDGFGNAWEWMQDLRTENNGLTGLHAAVRGGAFFFDFRPNPSGERSGFPPELRRKTTGLRCAKDDGGAI